MYQHHQHLSSSLQQRICLNLQESPMCLSWAETPLQRWRERGGERWSERGGEREMERERWRERDGESEVLKQRWRERGAETEMERGHLSPCSHLKALHIRAGKIIMC